MTIERQASACEQKKLASLDPKQLAEAFVGYEFGCKPEKFDLVCEAAKAHLAHLTKSEETSMSQTEMGGWLDIAWFDGEGVVHVIGMDNPIMHQAIAYKCNHEWFVLNSNECEEGSEVLQWEPTHYIPLPKPPTNTKPQD